MKYNESVFHLKIDEDQRGRGLKGFVFTMVVNLLLKVK